MQREEKSTSRQPGEGFSWVATFIVAMSCLLACLVLVHSTRIFTEMLTNLGVQLPFATRFFLASYRWLLPILFVGSAVAVVAKEFLLRGVARRLGATVIVFLIAASSVGVIVYLLHLPMLELIQKLER
jgi:hypothetical protein